MNERRDEFQDAAVAERLRVYADARLRPDEQARERMRARVMREAQRLAVTRSDERAAGAPHAVPDPGDGPAHARRRRGRFLPALLAAAATLLLVGGTVLAARPGSPLYPVRLWVEDIVMPTDEDGRAAARLDQLDTRLTEVEAAAASGDAGALQAALDAYRATIDDALETDAATDNAERLEAALRHHLVVLESLLGKVPPQARGALERAIDRSDRAVDQIEQEGTPGRPPRTPAPVQPSTTPAPTARPERTPQGPRQTPRPSRTPPGQASKPPATATPEATNEGETQGRPSQDAAETDGAAETEGAEGAAETEGAPGD